MWSFMYAFYLLDIGADVLDLSGSTLELGDKLKLEPVSNCNSFDLVVAPCLKITLMVYLITHKPSFHPFAM